LPVLSALEEALEEEEAEEDAEVAEYRMQQAWPNL